MLMWLEGLTISLSVNTTDTDHSLVFTWTPIFCPLRCEMTRYMSSGAFQMLKSELLPIAVASVGTARLLSSMRDSLDPNVE